MLYKGISTFIYTIILGNKTMTSNEPEPEPEPEPSSANILDASHEVNVTELDLSGYNYDLVPTYKMIEDPDDQDSLFRIQFLQAFGINDDEYHPDIVSAVIDDLYERFRENRGIREILEAHPLYHANAHTQSDERDRDPPASSFGVNDNSEMIFCMMFSFQLFDLFHRCIRHAKHQEEIPQEIRDEIKESWRTMF
jgi:hypothetical protein